MKKDGKIVIGFILGFTILMLIPFIVFGILYLNNNKEKNTWEVVISNQFINVRSDAGTNFSLIGEVSFNEKYEVIEMFLEDESYNWYRIKLDKSKTGWVATPKNGSWIIDINNPNGDIYAPIIKSDKNVLYFNTEDDINYNHLTISDTSDYIITHNIYNEGSLNYWIEFIVTDSNNNETKIVQKGIFNENPTNVIEWENR